MTIYLADFILADFIDKMTNPAFGVGVNEDYGLQFAENKTFQKSLKIEAKRLKDPAALTLSGWLWLIAWARSRDVDLDEGLLMELTLGFPSSFMQANAIELATRHKKPKKSPKISSLKTFPQPWLRKLLQRATSNTTRLAETVLFALLQVGTDVCLDAATTLLHHNWSGGSRLLESYWARWGELSEDTQKLWEERLHMPRRDQL